MLRPIEGRLNTALYISFLNSLASKSFANAIPPFVHDHDHYPVHCSRAVNEWFYCSSSFYVLPWPKLSGDLNVANELWNVIYSKVNASSEPIESIVELNRIVVDCWNSVVRERKHICSLIAGLSSKLDAVLKSSRN